jgi:hypothetical protein
MNSIEKSLDKIAENILNLDETSLAFLWDQYKNKAEQFSFSPEWEKAVIGFSINNGVRIKNAIFNELILNKKEPQETPSRRRPQEKPHLKLVK